MLFYLINFCVVQFLSSWTTNMHTLMLQLLIIETIHVFLIFIAEEHQQKFTYSGNLKICSNAHWVTHVCYKLGKFQRQNILGTDKGTKIKPRKYDWQPMINTAKCTLPYFLTYMKVSNAANGIKLLHANSR